MISFLFKKAPVVFDVFTWRSDVYEYAQWKNAARFLPEWWKALPKEVTQPGGYPAATMRTCAGFVDLYRHGFMLPMWADVFVDINQEGYAWRCADGRTNAESHDQSDAGSFLLGKKAANFKLISPWLIKSKESVRCYVSAPFWNTDLDIGYTAPPAVVDFSKQAATNVNLLLLNGDQPRQFIIPFGTPLLHYIPLTERPFKLKQHLISESEFVSLRQVNAPISFINSYRKKLKAKEASK